MGKDKFKKEVEEQSNKQQHELAENVQRMLAYGSVNLVLSSMNMQNTAEERIKEDLKK